MGNFCAVSLFKAIQLSGNLSSFPSGTKVANWLEAFLKQFVPVSLGDAVPLPDDMEDGGVDTDRPRVRESSGEELSDSGRDTEFVSGGVMVSDASEGTGICFQKWSAF